MIIFLSNLFYSLFLGISANNIGYPSDIQTERSWLTIRFAQLHERDKSGNPIIIIDGHAGSLY